jgi:hypothetical protein
MSFKDTKVLAVDNVSAFTVQSLESDSKASGSFSLLKFGEIGMNNFSKISVLSGAPLTLCRLTEFANVKSTWVVPSNIQSLAAGLPRSQSARRWRLRFF